MWIWTVHKIQYFLVGNVAPQSQTIIKAFSVNTDLHVWFHAPCQRVGNMLYDYLSNSDCSWHCIPSRVQALEMITIYNAAFTTPDLRLAFCRYLIIWKTLSVKYFPNFPPVRIQLTSIVQVFQKVMCIIMSPPIELGDILFLARLYESTGRAIAVTTVSMPALALLKMLNFLVKVFKSLYLLNPMIHVDLLDTLPDVRYWSEVLCYTITTHIGDLKVKGTCFEILS